MKSVGLKASVLILIVCAFVFIQYNDFGADNSATTANDSQLQVSDVTTEAEVQEEVINTEEVFIDAQEIQEINIFDETEDTIISNEPRFGYLENNIYISDDLGLKFSLGELWEFTQIKPQGDKIYEFVADDIETTVQIRLFTIDIKDGKTIDDYLSELIKPFENNTGFVVEEINDVIIAGRQMIGFSSLFEDAAMEKTLLNKLDEQKIYGITFNYDLADTKKVDKIIFDFIEPAEYVEDN